MGWTSSWGWIVLSTPFHPQLKATHHTGIKGRKAAVRWSIIPEAPHLVTSSGLRSRHLLYSLLDLDPEMHMVPWHHTKGGMKSRLVYLFFSFFPKYRRISRVIKKKLDDKEERDMCIYINKHQRVAEEATWVSDSSEQKVPCETCIHLSQYPYKAISHCSLDHHQRHLSWE